MCEIRIQQDLNAKKKQKNKTKQWQENTLKICVE
jgi:hypothetical protein